MRFNSDTFFDDFEKKMNKKMAELDRKLNTPHDYLREKQKKTKKHKPAGSIFSANKGNKVGVTSAVPDFYKVEIKIALADDLPVVCVNRADKASHLIMRGHNFDWSTNFYHIHLEYSNETKRLVIDKQKLSDENKKLNEEIERLTEKMKKEETTLYSVKK